MTIKKGNVAETGAASGPAEWKRVYLTDRCLDETPRYPTKLPAETVRYLLSQVLSMPPLRGAKSAVAPKPHANSAAPR
jgi:hypothetical protein